MQRCKAFLRKTVSTTFTGGRDWDTFPSPPQEGLFSVGHAAALTGLSSQIHQTVLG